MNWLIIDFKLIISCENSILAFFQSQFTYAQIATSRLIIQTDFMGKKTPTRLFKYMQMKCGCYLFLDPLDAVETLANDAPRIWVQQHGNRLIDQSIR